jgi:mevalonate kinase
LAAAVMTLHARKITAQYFIILKGKPIVDKVSFNPFKENIYFVYLNKKQSSKTAIANYQNNKTKNINKSIDAISKITLEILHATLHFFASN